jgi:hypothetical protein
VKRVLDGRPWWIELPNTSPAFNFKWQPISWGIKFDSLNTTAGIKQIVNHFEFHIELSKKSNVFINMQLQAEVILKNNKLIAKQRKRL